MRKIIRMSLGIRITILLLLVYAVIMAGVFFYTQIQTRIDVMARLEERLDDYMATTARDLDRFFDTVRADVLTLASWPEVRNPSGRPYTSFLDADPLTFRYNYTPGELNLIQLFESYRREHRHINSVYMGFADGSFVRSHPRAIPTRYDPRERPWYREAALRPGHVIQTSPYESVTTTDTNIGTVLALSDSRGEVYAVIGMDVTLEYLQQHFSLMQLPFNGWLELWDRDGLVRISDYPERLMKPGDGGDFSFSPGKHQTAIESNTALFRYRMTLENPPGQLVAYVTRPAVNAAVQGQFRGRFLLLTLELLVVLVVVLLFLRQFVFRPIHDMEYTLVNLRDYGTLTRMNVKSDGELADFQEQYNHLVSLIEQERQELKKTKFLVITSLASLAQRRDNETGLHIIRTQKYMDILTGAWNRLYPDQLIQTAEATLMVLCAPLHDIGKVAIPDRILMKPGPLTENEFEEMKLHTVFGREAIEKANVEISDRLFMTTALAIVYSHHERWDGTGYPEAISGESIPVEARFMALADVYDALTTERVYKKAFTHEFAVKVIRDGAGTQFDPRVVNAFLESEKEFLEVSLLYHESPPSISGSE